MWLTYWVPPHIPPSASSHDLVHEIGSEIRTNVLRSLTYKPKQEIYCIFIDKGSHTHHYRKGRSTELLLMYLAATWQQAIDKKLVVGAVFILSEGVQLRFTLNSSSQARAQLWNHGNLTAMAEIIYLIGNCIMYLMAYPLRIPKLYMVYHRAPYSGPYSSPCTQAIYRLQLTLQRHSCMLMILPCTV